MACKYMVIETKDENGEAEVCVVPEVWIKNGKCYWPPGNESTKLRKCDLPLDNWMQYEFATLKAGFSKYLENV